MKRYLLGILILSVTGLFGCEESAISGSASSGGESSGIISNNTTLPEALTSSDSLTLNWSPGDGAQFVTISISSDGGETWLDLAKNVNALSGSKSVDLTSLIDGTYQVRMTATSNKGSSQSINLGQVVVDNADPVAPSDKGPLNLNEDASSYAFDLNAGSDANALTYVITQAPTASEGTLSGCTGGDSQRTCSFVPAANFSGAVTIKYKARDIAGNLSPEATVTLQVLNQNDAPVLSASCPTSAANGSAYSCTVNVSDLDSGD